MRGNEDNATQNQGGGNEDRWNDSETTNSPGYAIIPNQRASSSTVLNEQMLVDDASLRSRFISQVDALDKVGELAMLPDDIHATTEGVADFYEVAPSVVRQIVSRNRGELEANGLVVLKGSSLQKYRSDHASDKMSLASKKTSQLTLWPREAVINLGMLLAGSEVAKTLRQYLIRLQANATVGQKQQAVEEVRIIRMQERMDYKTVLDSLKEGGTTEGLDYARVQNTLYIELYGVTAKTIIKTRKQQTGKAKKRGLGFCKSTVAKDYLTTDEINRLDSTVLAVAAQLQHRYPNGATADQMIDVIKRSVKFLESA